MTARQFATPLLIRNGKPASLHRIEFDDNFRDEDWVQELLFEHPQLIPFDDLEPAFNGSVAVAREVESGAGPIDVLYVNGDGLLTLVETKLWRNSQSRREVVSQLFEYAANLARMTYEDLAAAASKAGDFSGDLMMERARQGEKNFDRKRFHDNVSRNLKRGRFLLLIVGDGIQEGVETMSEYLQTQPHLGFTLGLVELALFRGNPSNDELIFVQPRLMARTREVVRAVVEVVENGSIRVTTPPEAVVPPGKRFKITEDEFFQRLAAAVEPEVVDFAKSLLKRVKPDHQLDIDWKQSGPLLKYIDPDNDVFFTFGGFDVDGNLAHTIRLVERCEELGLPDSIWQDYFATLIRLVPGASLRHFRSKAGNEWDEISYSDDARPLKSLMARQGEWLAAIDRAVAEIRKTLPVK